MLFYDESFINSLIYAVQMPHSGAVMMMPAVWMLKQSAR